MRSFLVLFAIESTLKFVGGFVIVTIWKFPDRFEGAVGVAQRARPQNSAASRRASKQRGHSDRSAAFSSEARHSCIAAMPPSPPPPSLPTSHADAAGAGGGACVAAAAAVEVARLIKSGYRIRRHFGREVCRHRRHRRARPFVVAAACRRRPARGRVGLRRVARRRQRREVCVPHCCVRRRRRRRAAPQRGKRVRWGYRGSRRRRHRRRTHRPPPPPPAAPPPAPPPLAPAPRL